jgi:cellulose synthase/poly-beta-1,6-N-acetylglucosamine synthase-like glycosyltransferase
MREGTFATTPRALAIPVARSSGLPAPPWVEGPRILERMRLLAGWEPLLDRLAIPREAAFRIAERARANGTGFHAEFVAAGLVTEDAHYRALADELGLPFAENVDADRLVLRDADVMAALRRPCGNSLAMCENGVDGPALIVAPTRLDLPAMKAMIARGESLSRRLCVTTPTLLREALFERARPLLVDEARGGLFARMPEMSARIHANWRQGCFLGAIAIAYPVAQILAPQATWLALHAFFSVVFLCCVGLRIAAGVAARATAPSRIRAAGADELPFYSVIVALRGEAAVVEELVASLGKLVWPRSKLEVKLICEADDAETLGTIAALRLRPWVEVIAVPPGEPRTKPKALAYALPLLSGDLIALYDAEDRPHPMQLLEAWDRFREDESGTLACVQAPLVIANASAGPLAALFRLEYAAHFAGILPWLSRRRWMFPLGGTSNHFRRDLLIEAGGWDPYNVTEDADLGLRLARFGYRSDTISAETLEDAPEEVMVWVRQRTRWFKGWMQTWLVHMHHPGRLMRELGPCSFAVAQIMFAGMILSAFAYPLLLASVAGLCVKLAWAGLSGGEAVVLSLALVNLGAAYASFLFLAWRCLDREGRRRGFWRTAAWMPAYWLLLSFAACRAVVELARRPHYWEKTPHKRFRRDAAGGPAI